MLEIISLACFGSQHDVICGSLLIYTVEKSKKYALGCMPSSDPRNALALCEPCPDPDVALGGKVI